MKDPMKDAFESLERAHAELGARMMRPTSRAEELIADLEAEIVKRDARIAELEQQRGGVVLPPSPYMPCVEPESLSDYDRGEAQGRCDMWAEVARLNPPGECVAVPRDVLQGLIWYADSLLGEVNAGARYAGCTAPDAEHSDSDYLEVSALLAQQGKAVGDE